MGGENEGGIECAVDLLHQVQDFFACLVVEIGRRFVRQHDRRQNRQGAGDRHPLPLPAAQLVGAMLGEFRQSNDVQKVVDTFLPLFRRHVLALQQRVFDVFRRRKHRQQVECLKNEPDRPVP